MSKRSVLPFRTVVLLIVCAGGSDREVAAQANRVGEPSVRERIIWKMDGKSIADPHVRDALVADLNHDDSRIRWAAAWALRRFRCPVVPPVVSLAASQNVSVRRVGTYVLIGQAEASVPAMQALLGALADDDPLVQAHAIGGLRLLGPQHARLRSLVIESAALLSRNATAAADGRPVPPLTALLDRMGPPHADDLPGLRLLLSANEEPVWWSAMRELMRLKEDADSAVPELRQIVNSADILRAHAAVIVLGSIGPKASPAAGDVIRFLRAQLDAVGPALPADAAGPFHASYRSMENRLKRQMQVLPDEIDALLRMQPDRAAARPLLMALVYTHLTRDEARARAVRERLRRGATVQSARRLTGAAGDMGNEQSAVRAMQALAQLDTVPPAAILELLDATELELQIAGIRTLRCYGPQAIGHVPRLRKLLSTPGLALDLRREIWATIGAIGPAAVAATPELAADAERNSTGHASEVIAALVQLSPAANPALANLVSHPDRHVRLIALRGIADGKGEDLAKSMELTSALAGRLRLESDQAMSIEVLRAIAILGHNGRALLPVLHERLPDLPDDKPVSVEWFAAYFAIDPQHPDTRALRNHWRHLAVRSSYVDMALPIVMRTGHCTIEDIEDDIKCWSPNNQEWSERWKSLAEKHVALLVRQAAQSTDERTQQGLYAALSQVDAVAHPDVVPPLVSIWKQRLRKNYVHDQLRLANFSLSRHSELAEELLTEWMAAESNHVRSRYAELLLLDHGTCREILLRYARQQDEASVRRLLASLAGLGRRGAVFAAVPREVLESHRPGLSIVAQETLRAILGTDLSLLPDLVAETAAIPQRENIQSLVAYGPVVSGTLEDRLRNPNITRGELLLILRSMEAMRQRFPTAWSDIDVTLGLWQSNPPVADVPEFIRRLAGACRRP